jgi:SAM-dependent methyltransferase
MSETTPDTSRQDPQELSGAVAPADNPWNYVQDWDVEMVGPELRDHDAVLRWSRAFCMAGGLPYIWKAPARPITEIVYSLLELREGDRVLVIGEAVEPVGWADEIRQVVGETGVVDVIEILPEARSGKGKTPGRNGMLGCWQWTYTRDIADEHYDCVAMLQSTQHCDDWRETGAEMLRIMKPGRRAVFAEAVWGGAHFRERTTADVHILEWVTKALWYADSENISQYTGEELKELMGEMFDNPQCLEWRGIEMFWGRKPE